MPVVAEKCVKISQPKVGKGHSIGGASDFVAEQKGQIAVNQRVKIAHHILL